MEAVREMAFHFSYEAKEGLSYCFVSDTPFLTLVSYVRSLGKGEAP